ncbi:MAG TPA: hypothetical protein PLZ82_10090, partial [Smithellaceae bacterium]|nr:hypothetical protein [Smithellaceae bacterium]
MSLPEASLGFIQNAQAGEKDIFGQHYSISLLSAKGPQKEKFSWKFCISTMPPHRFPSRILLWQR